VVAWNLGEIVLTIQLRGGGKGGVASGDARQCRARVTLSTSWNQ